MIGSAMGSPTAMNPVLFHADHAANKIADGQPHDHRHQTTASAST